MHRQSLIVSVLVVTVIVPLLTVVAFPGFANRWAPLAMLGNSITHLGSSTTPIGSSDGLVAGNQSPTAPEFAPGTWINSKPLTLKGLRGRVVLVQFWTFGCYNCRNTLPAVKKWDTRYRDKGLTIIGVHSPEFEREKNIDNLRHEVSSLGIRYAVVTDNDYETWRAYGIDAWPTVVILDKEGRIRWTHVGEGLYNEQESVINKLLGE